MGELVWKNEYSIGNYQTDDEHKKLISLANKVIGFSNTGEDQNKIQDTLKALHEYTLIHFRNEENFMARLGFPEIEHHKQCHIELIERLNKIITQNASQDDLIHDLKRLMVVWVIEHIINEDHKITQYI